MFDVTQRQLLVGIHLCADWAGKQDFASYGYVLGTLKRS